jgi:hypothetical protein
MGGGFELRRLSRRTRNATVVLLAGLAVTADALAEEPAGDWLGTILGPRGEARFLLHVRRSADGAYVGVQDDLDLCVKGLPLGSFKATATTLAYVFAPTGARFEASWDEAAARWRGSYRSPQATYPMELIRETSVLTGRGVSIRLVDGSGDPAVHRGETHVTFKDRELWLTPDAPITSDMAASARARSDAGERPVVDVTLNAVGKARLDALTRANIGRRVAILVDGKIVAAPIIRDEMAQGRAEIAGDFSSADACLLAEEIAPIP